MHRRFDAGPLLAAAGAGLRLVSLFMSCFDVDLNAWEVFEALDLVLAGLAAAIIVLALRPRPDGRLLVGLAAAALVIVVVQLIEPPPSVSDEADREVGAWLALAGAGLVALGAALRVARINVSVTVGGRDARRRVQAVDRRTAPAETAAPAPAAATAAPAADDTQATQPFSAFEDR